MKSDTRNQKEKNINMYVNTKYKQTRIVDGVPLRGCFFAGLTLAEGLPVLLDVKDGVRNGDFEAKGVVDPDLSSNTSGSNTASGPFIFVFMFSCGLYF